MKQLFAYGKQRSGSAFFAYDTVIYETTCRSDVRPTIFKRALEGEREGNQDCATLMVSPRNIIIIKKMYKKEFLMILTVTLNPCIDRTLNVSNFRVGGTTAVSGSRAEIGGKG